MKSQIEKDGAEVEGPSKTTIDRRLDRLVQKLVRIARGDISPRRVNDEIELMLKECHAIKQEIVASYGRAPDLQAPAVSARQQ